MNINFEISYEFRELFIKHSMESMTGFGNSSVKREQFSVTVSCRSVNHKALNISFRAPDVLSKVEYSTVKRIRELFSRGRISIQVELTFSGDDNSEIKVDTDALISLADSAKTAAESAGVEGTVSIGEFLGLPGIVLRKSFSDIPGDELRDAYDKALDECLQELKECRLQEGEALVPVFTGGFRKIQNLVLPIPGNQKENVARRFKKMRTRIMELLSDTAIDENRLMSELALMADRSDVAEEHQRILCHIDRSLELIDSDETAIGRKFGFFIQEIHRELNTMGAKVDDADTSTIVIEMKNILSSLKEQAANIE